MTVADATKMFDGVSRHIQEVFPHVVPEDEHGNILVLFDSKWPHDGNVSTKERAKALCALLRYRREHPEQFESYADERGFQRFTFTLAEDELNRPGFFGDLVS